jgi:prepilin-type N-terminal cleavage/methylation domain-containing protein
VAAKFTKQFDPRFAAMKLNRNKTRLVEAFTLLEILVALALLSVVMIAIYSSWNAVVKGTRVGLDAAAAGQRSRISMRTLQDSLLSACMFAQNGRYYGFVADTEGDYASLSFVARLPRSFPRSGRFDGVDVRRVNFTVESVGENKNCLVLRQYPLLLLEPDHVEEQHPLVLAKDVTKFMLEFWDQQSGDWATSWDTTNRLPQMVRITLGLGHLDQYSSQPQDLMFGVVALASVGVGPGAGVFPGQMPGQVPGQLQPGQVPGQVPGQLQPGIGNPLKPRGGL